MSPDTPGGQLTPVGRRQARRAGRRLAAWPITAVYSSDVRRAVETAELMAPELGPLPIRQTTLLREVNPTAMPWPVPLRARRFYRRQVEEAYRRFFRASRSTRHELLVCHGQLIRSLVCVVQEIPLTKWVKLAISNASVTRFAVWANGQVTLVAYNETGHLPPELITSESGPLARVKRR